jgi:hypothetical protein
MDNVYVLNSNFEIDGVIDTYNSCIWTERYYTNGDFELHLPFDLPTYLLLARDKYLKIPESETLMIIEKRLLTFDEEKRYYMTIVGRTVDVILHRRIVWNQMNFDPNYAIQDAVLALLNDNVINAIDVRKISNFIFEASTDPNVTSKKLLEGAQYFNDDLFDAIQSLCETNKIGFNVLLTADKKFKFKLYAGTDRSLSGMPENFVIFSPEFQNLIDSSYVETSEDFKNVGKVIGEGEGGDQKTTTCCSIPVTDPDYATKTSGIERREVCIEATDLSSITEEEDINGNLITMSDAEYLQKLSQRGTEELKNYPLVQSFEGSCDSNVEITYVLNRDYFLGDIVQVVNEYGISGTARITEIIRSKNESEDKIYPTFS